MSGRALGDVTAEFPEVGRMRQGYSSGYAHISVFSRECKKPHYDAVLHAARGKRIQTQLHFH